MKHVIFFSGGIGSFCAAHRVVEEHGPDDVSLLFTDTNMEDGDLYRFLTQGSALLGAELVWLKNDGKDPWDIFFENRFLGNSRIDPCSRILKRESSRKWVEEHFQPDEVTLYLGIDWTEIHRCESIERNWKPYPVRFPLCEPPYIDKDQQHKLAERVGIDPPRLTAELGFPHNNCGGFCVKGGHAHFKHFLEKFPERYAYHEQKEQEIREYLDKDVSILREQRDGVKYRLTLQKLRKRIEEDGGGEQCEIDWGGCGCFTDYEDEDDTQEETNEDN